MAKIMIVDDSNLSRRLLKAILEPSGHQVIEADEGMAAIEKYFIEKPAAVFLDMTMKGMHGLDVLRQLRAMDGNARVIIATADIQGSTRDMSTAGGATAFIEKPFASDKVLRALEEALKGN